MDPYLEEDRIADLLRELIAQSGTSPAALERRLGWEPGRLAAFLDSRRLSFADVLEVLPLLGMTPTDFFARLYGSVPPAAYSPSKQRAMERLFQRSLRAVRSAVARRAAWKRERTDET
jgi:hypothetical protein